MAQAKNPVSRGELEMRQLLTWLIDCETYSDGQFYSWLVNPRTGRPMQLDRYYPSLKLAFEFQGEQHDQYTGLQRSVEAFVALQERDVNKATILGSRGITLVEVRESDLAVEVLKRKLPKHIPIREVAGDTETDTLLMRLVQYVGQGPAAQLLEEMLEALVSRRRTYEAVFNFLHDGADESQGGDETQGSRERTSRVGSYVELYNAAKDKGAVLKLAEQQLSRTSFWRLKKEIGAE